MRLIDIEDAALLKTVSCGGLSAKKLWKRINEQPTIEIAKPKTGHWILTPMISDNYRYECSNCMGHHRERYDFCPNCGADMRKEESEEDYDYERAVDQMEHDIAYEPTYNPEDGSM